MSQWLTRSVLSGSSVDPNGTTSHTCSFTAATNGNYLVAVVAGAVTFTTPPGWTLSAFAVNNTALYVFTKIASAGENSFTTTHNGSNYAIRGIVYEFAAGTTFLGSNYDLNGGAGAVSGPTLNGLTGTYTLFGARCHGLTLSSGTMDVTWTTPSTSDYQEYVGAAANAGVGIAVAYQAGLSASSESLAYTMSYQNTANATGESLIFALDIPAPVDNSVNLLRIGSIAPTKLYVGTLQATRAFLGTTLVYGVPVGTPVPNLYVTPASGTYHVGDTVQLQVRVDSQAVNVNAVQADFTYTAGLSFQSISHTGSPFTTTIQNTGGGGEVKIGVGILAGSTSGDQIVATVTFTVTATGTSVIAFKNSSGIADAATSSDICQALNGASYVIS